MSKIYYQSFSLSKLNSRFEDHSFAIPQIQRRFVWKKKQVCDLMDSIFHHIPIGVFLVWRTDELKVAELRPHSNSIIPSFNFRNKIAEIIIDRQQRLSSVYGVLAGINPEDEENSQIDFRNIFFNTDPKAEEKFFYSARLNGSDSSYIQLCELLSFQPSVIWRRYKLSKSRLQEVQRCHSQFYAYKFYSLIIESKNSREIEDTFIRINSKGTPAKRADILFARAAKVALRERVEETRRGLKHGMKHLKIDTFISTVALINGETRIGRVALENFVRKFNKRKINKTEFKKDWKKYSIAFSLANDFLVDEFKITNLTLLPSENIFTMLSLFFYYRRARASPAQREQLRKWFWHTTFDDRYSGAKFNRNIPKDIRFIGALAKHTHKYSFDTKIDPLEFLKKEYRSKRSTAVRGFYLLLKNSHPLYLDTGTEMQMEEVAASKNRRDRHHIFPQHLFKVNQSKWKHSLVNICFLAKDTNIEVGGNYPADYLEEFSKRKYFKRVMRSHLIPYGCEGLWQKNLRLGFRDFINERAVLILDKIEKTAGMRRWQMFEKFDSIIRI